MAECFSSGYFPQSKWSWFGSLNDWRQSDTAWLLPELRQRFGDEPYVLIGFSDGGTLAHEIAAADTCCAGLIVHSGMWRAPRFLAKCPVLLLRTIGDRTPTFDSTGKAFHSYLEQDRKVALETLPPLPERCMRHQFANGLASMQRWCRYVVGFDLPLTEGAIV